MTQQFVITFSKDCQFPSFSLTSYIRIITFMEIKCVTYSKCHYKHALLYLCDTEQSNFFHLTCIYPTEKIFDQRPRRFLSVWDKGVENTIGCYKNVLLVHRSQRSMKICQVVSPCFLSVLSLANLTSPWLATWAWTSESWYMNVHTDKTTNFSLNME